MPGSPEIRSRGLTAVTGTFRPTDWDRRAVPVSHPSRIATDRLKPDSDPGPTLRAPDCHPPPLIFASRNGTAAIRMCPGHRRPLVSGILRNATGGKSRLTVAATDIGDGTKALNPFNVRLVIVRLNGRLLHSSSRTRQWRWPSPAPGAALRMVFVGGSRPARCAPAVRPSGPAVSPAPAFHGRSAHQPMWPNRRPAGRPHNARPTGDAYEAKRSGRARAGDTGPHDPRTSRPGYSPGLTF